MRTLLVWLACSAVALAQNPTERKPNGDFENSYPRWAPYVNPSAVFDSKQGQIIDGLDCLSVDFDSRGVMHIVGRHELIGVSFPKIVYMNNRYDLRQANGWSVPVVLDEVNQFVDNVTRPVLTVRPDDSLGVAWEWSHNDFIFWSDIKHCVKTSAGWGPVGNITNGSYGYCQQPQIEANDNGVDHILFSQFGGQVFHNFGGAGGPIQSVYNLSVFTPTGFFERGTLRMVPVPGSPEEVWAVGHDGSGVWFNHRDSTGTWDSNWTQFGQSGDTFPDIVRDSAGTLYASCIRGSSPSADVIFFSGALFGTEQTVFSGITASSARILTDSRGQVGILTANGSQPWFAAKVKNPNPNVLSSNFYTQTPIVAPLANTKEMFDPWDAAISNTDQIAVVDTDTITWTLEYDLKAFSNAAAISAGADGGPGGGDGGGGGGGGGGRPPGITTGGCVCPCGPTTPPRVPSFLAPTINAINGNVSFDLPLFSTNGIAPSQSCSLHYNTQDLAMSSIAPGWRMNYEWVVIDCWTGVNSFGVDTILLSIPGERDVHFVWNGSKGYHVAEDEYGYYAKLFRTSTDFSVTEYVLTNKFGLEMTFNNAGKLRRIEELTDNFISLEFTGGSLTTVRDQVGNGPVVGRTTTIAYESTGNELLANRVTRITDHNLKRYDLGYNGNELATVKFFDGPSQPTWGFDYYDFGNPGPDGFRAALKQIRTPEGQAAGTPYGQTYEYYPDGRFKGLDDPAELFLADPDPDTFTPTLPAVASTTISFDETGDPFTGVRVTTYTNRRGFQHKIYNEPRRSLVTRVEDAAFLMGEPGISAMIYAYDTSVPVNRNLTQLNDRWGFATNYFYAAPPGGTQIPVQDNLFQIWRPKQTIAGQDKVVEILYTTDDHNRIDKYRTFAAPTGGGAAVQRESDYNWNAATGLLENVVHPQVTRPDGTVQSGVTTSYLYGSRKQLTQITGEENLHTNFTAFDPLHWLPLTVIRDGDAQAESLTYDVMGNLASQTRPQGGAGNEIPGPTIFGRDGMYRVTSITDPAGKITGFGYTRNSQLNLVDPPVGDNTTTAYDKREFVKSGVTPDGSWSQFVDANGNVSRVINLRGFASNYDFEGLDHLSESRVPGGTTLGAGLGGGYNEVVVHNSVTYTGIHITVIDDHSFSGGVHFQTVTQLGAPADRVTKTEFNNRGLASAVLEADLATRWEMFHDEQDQEVARQLRYSGVLQTATLMFRDARDRVDRVRVQDTAYLTTPTLESNTYTLYNKANSVVRTVDPLGQVNPLLRPHTVEVVRDVRERAIQVIDGKNVVVQENVFGGDDLVTTSRWCNPATKTSALVTRMTYTYTKRKELKSSKNLNGDGMDYTYGDLPDQIATATNDGGIITETTYETFTQRVFEVVEAKATADESRTKYLWTNGLLSSTTVWNPATLAYDAVHGRDYDKANRLERLTAPAVASGTQIAVERYFFSAFDETKQFIAGTKTIAHAYNAISQPTQSVWTGAYAVTVNRLFDEIGNLKSIDDGSRKREMDYEKWINNPTEERFFIPGMVPAWKTQTHGFDVAKNYRTLADAEGGSHAWEVDENNRVTDLKFGALLVSKLHYTPGGLLDKTEHFNAAGALIATTTEFYDTLGRLSERRTVQGSAGATLSDFVWGYDTRDRRTSINLVHQSLVFTLGYDERDQLVSEVTPGNGMIPARNNAWAYDKAGNRLTQTLNTVVTNYTYNAASQLKTEVTPSQNKTRNYNYDEWANLSRTSTTIGAPPGPIALQSERFGYNYLNLLSTYQPGPIPIQPGGGSPPNGWQYDYWPTGERAAKTNLSANPDSSELYVPRFGDVVTEYSQLGAGAITFTNRYVQGTGIDSKTTRITAGGVRTHYIGDGVGTVALTLNDAAGIQEQTIRDAWGVRLSATPSAERYGFAQREHDNESQLVHMRWRQYDPRIGRFTQTEPIRVLRPQMHYKYTANSPASHTDPHGLQLFPPFHPPPPSIPALNPLANLAKWLADKLFGKGTSAEVILAIEAYLREQLNEREEGGDSRGNRFTGINPAPPTLYPLGGIDIGGGVKLGPILIVPDPDTSAPGMGFAAGISITLGKPEMSDEDRRKKAEEERKSIEDQIRREENKKSQEEEQRRTGKAASDNQNRQSRDLLIPAPGLCDWDVGLSSVSTIQ